MCWRWNGYSYVCWVGIIIDLAVILFFIRYLDRIKYGIVYNPFANPSLKLDRNKSRKKRIFSAPCSEFMENKVALKND